MKPEPTSVLFLCRNAASRGPMAKALLETMGAERFQSVCAATEPGPMHPHTITILSENGIDIEHLVCHSLRALLGRTSFVYAIVLKGADEADAPRLFPGAMKIEQWDIPDPGDAGLEVFQSLYARLGERIGEWVAEHASLTDRVLVHH